MKSVRLSMTAALIAGALVAVPGMAAAEEGAAKDLASYKCKDFMRVGGSEREIAIAFLHGYLIGKEGTTKFNTDDAEGHNKKFVEHCLDNPGDSAIDAMAKAKK